MTEEYWVYDWIDEFQVRSGTDAHRAAAAERAFQRAVELARNQPRVSAASLASVPQESVVAGRGIDLSLRLSCAEYECRIRQIDELFATSGHYFDHVVVEGLTPADFLHEATARGDEARVIAANTLATYARVLLYIREIGAEPYILFRSKPHAFCVEHYREHAEELGIPAPLDEGLTNSLVELIERDAVLERFDYGKGRRGYWFKTSLEDIGHVLFETDPSSPLAPDVHSLSQQVVANHALAAISDYALAKRLRLPLTSTADKILDRVGTVTKVEVSDETRAHSALLAVRVPILSGLTARELIAARRDNAEQFAKFRRALTFAVREQVMTGSSRDPKEVAAAVLRDYIEPTVADIEVSLKASRRALSRKAVQNVSVGAVLVTVGLLANLPLVLSAGIAATSGTLLHANKYADERRDLETRDLFFLWNVARKHAGKA